MCAHLLVHYKTYMLLYLLRLLSYVTDWVDCLPFLNNYFLVFSPSVKRMCLFWFNPLDDIVVFTA